MELIKDLPDRLLFAVPKKGRLHTSCLSLLEGADIQFHRKNRLDIALVKNLPIALVFLPAGDIAKFVGEGNVDLGITGQDMVAEANAQDKVTEILELGFGKCRLCVQVPVKGGAANVDELVGKRIATSFEGIAGSFFDQIDAKANNGKKTELVFVSGSVEAACALGLADGIGKCFGLCRDISQRECLPTFISAISHSLWTNCCEETKEKADSASDNNTHGLLYPEDYHISILSSPPH